jgi:hypothetical protein
MGSLQGRRAEFQLIRESAPNKCVGIFKVHKGTWLLPHHVPKNPPLATTVKAAIRLLTLTEADLQPSGLEAQQQLQQLHQFAVICVNINFSELTLEQKLEYTTNIEGQRAA